MLAVGEAGPESIVVSGGVVSIVHVRLAWRALEVAGRVERAHQEGVLAGAPGRCRLCGEVHARSRRRRASTRRLARVLAREGDRRAGARRRGRRAGVDRRLGRDRVDRPAVARRRRRCCRPRRSPAPGRCGRPARGRCTWPARSRRSKAAASSAHSYVTPDSLAPNVNSALVVVLTPPGVAGPEAMLVLGASMSAGGTIVQVWTAGEGSMLPARSVARTRNVVRAFRQAGELDRRRARGVRGAVQLALEPATASFGRERGASPSVSVVGLAGPESMVEFGG